ncbi:AAA family ATPase [Singulisphaera sp. Ch08]|uniref:AAA family ATPase n=1 Tax=Singulisphaera sp. Ch08 TaxID=3120278 RepID=A0AAU7CH76_9BACT
MYEAHFGLSGRPFGETVNTSAYVSLPSRDTVLRRIRYGLEHGQGPALIFGASGMGKTLLARTLARELGGASAHVVFPAMPGGELLALLAEELGAGIAGDDTTVTGPLKRLRSWLATASARGERPLLIVDEAHLIDDPTTFESLRLLLNFATNGPPDLSLLLVGGPEILLRIPPGLADRLTARCLLGPLTAKESAAYLLGRLSIVGATSPLFSPETLELLHRAADGMPRRLNRLADLALLIAYAEGQAGPDSRTVSIAARELDFEGMAA